jgi:hypothetical protein
MIRWLARFTTTAAVTIGVVVALFAPFGGSDSATPVQRDSLTPAARSELDDACGWLGPATRIVVTDREAEFTTAEVTCQDGVTITTSY